jgi:hypothetical protein
MSLFTSQSIRPDSLVNYVSIVVSPNPLEPTPSIQTVEDADSQGNYGVQSISIDGSLLATNADAELLADYLIRPDPNFWFTGLSFEMAALTEAQRDAITTLEIGSLVAVRKSFKYGTPSVVTKTLYVEGIEHRLTPAGHRVDLYFSPVGFSEAWQDVTGTLQWGQVAAGLSWTNLIWNQL